jgi:hypothetical protein
LSSIPDDVASTIRAKPTVVNRDPRSLKKTKGDGRLSRRMGTSSIPLPAARITGPMSLIPENTTTDKSGGMGEGYRGGMRGWRLRADEKNGERAENIEGQLVASHFDCRATRPYEITTKAAIFHHGTSTR